MNDSRIINGTRKNIERQLTKQLRSVITNGIFIALSVISIIIFICAIFTVKGSGAGGFIQILLMFLCTALSLLVIEHLIGCINESLLELKQLDKLYGKSLAAREADCYEQKNNQRA